MENPKKIEITLYRHPETGEISAVMDHNFRNLTEVKMVLQDVIAGID